MPMGSEVFVLGGALAGLGRGGLCRAAAGGARGPVEGAVRGAVGAGGRFRLHRADTVPRGRAQFRGGGEWERGPGFPGRGAQMTSTPRRPVRCWSLLIGSQRLRTRSSFSRADERLIQRITAEHFPEGYTILAARGGWYDPARRRFIREATRQVLVTAASLAQARA